MWGSFDNANVSSNFNRRPNDRFGNGMRNQFGTERGPFYGEMRSRYNDSGDGPFNGLKNGTFGLKRGNAFGDGMSGQFHEKRRFQFDSTLPFNGSSGGSFGNKSRYTFEDEMSDQFGMETRGLSEGGMWDQLSRMSRGSLYDVKRGAFGDVKKGPSNDTWRGPLDDIRRGPSDDIRGLSGYRRGDSFNFERGNPMDGNFRNSGFGETFNQASFIKDWSDVELVSMLIDCDMQTQKSLLGPRYMKELCELASKRCKGKELVAPGSTELYVRTLRADHTEAVIRKYFSNWGTITNVEFYKYRMKGVYKPRKACTLTFTDRSMAEKAFLAGPHRLKGKPLQVSQIPFSYFGVDGIPGAILQFPRRLFEILKHTQPASKKDATKSSTRKLKPLKFGNSTVRASCDTFLGDPHRVCVFCRGKLLSTTRPCFTTTQSCSKCCDLSDVKRQALVKRWKEQTQDTNHSCYWNMSSFLLTLEPKKVTPFDFQCEFCQESVSRNLQAIEKHVKNLKHERTKQYRNETLPVLIMESYDNKVSERLKLEEEGATLKFCEDCFLHYEESQQEKHDNSEAHKLMKLYRVISCDTCEEKFPILSDYQKHCYTSKHLTNVLADRIESGDEEMENYAAEISKKNMVGLDLIRERPTLYCILCDVHLPVGGVSLQDHCRTKEHYQTLKQLLKGEKNIDNISEENEEDDDKSDDLMENDASTSDQNP